MPQNVTVPVEGKRAAPLRSDGEGCARAPARGQRGITLIEMLTVLALVGVLTALSVGAVGPLRNSLERHELFHRVTAAVTNARQLAMNSGDCVYVELVQDYDAVADRYQTAVTTIGVQAQALRVQRLPLAQCATSNVYSLYPFPSTPPPNPRLVEIIDMPSNRPPRQPGARTYRSAVIATSSSLAGPPTALPIIFRPNGRVHGRESNEFIDLFVIDRDAVSYTSDRRIRINGYGRVCVFDDVLVGGERCY
jgi:prepilin-type N-terminal cleavage/methylation domain-containing protein